jgi:hypothetical protein
MGGVSPWLAMVDPARFAASVDRVQGLDITTIAGCHTPVIEGDYIDKAFARVRELPTLDLPELPNQTVLEQIVAATAAAHS